MGLLSLLTKKNNNNSSRKEASKAAADNTLAEDIKISAEWVRKNLNISGYKVDYNLESMKEIDRFFDEQTKEGGLLSGKCGYIIFSLGSFIGETLIKECGGKWITNDDDPQGEVNIQVQLEQGGIVWPVQRCMKRLQNGPEDGIYAYVLGISKH